MVESQILDFVVVGAGPAGLILARGLQERLPDASVLLLESTDKNLSRPSTGMHLLNDEDLEHYKIESTQSFLPLKLRWERAWVDPMDVDWKLKDWIDNLPQWSLLMRGPRKLYKALPESSIEVAVKWQCPVSALVEIDHGERKIWKLVTPKGDLFAHRVIWGAGITAFQNAVGKIESQAYLVANPRFEEDAMEYRGGLALEFEISSAAAIAEDVPSENLLGLPVRHEGKLYLSFVTISPSDPSKETWKIQTLTHLPTDHWADPKWVASFQKSLRRSVKALIKSESDLGHERWVVSPAILGHIMGLRGIFGQGIPGRLDFVGDETLAAQSLGHWDLLSAIDSTLGVLNELEPSEKPLPSEVSDSLSRIVL